MCINPRLHPTGLKTPCHQCWQCRENKVNDWVGRCIAERETSLAATVVTLTYGGGDTPESRFLRKSDITTYMKTLRNAGHKVRFFAVGEYGSKKGRSHWHVVLFWQSTVPHLEFRKNVNDEYWPHGHSMWDNCNTAGIRYVMKYINKDAADPNHAKSMGMSRKPILGWNYFVDLAGRYVDQGIAPQKPFYKFRDVLDKNGKPIEFYMPPLVAEQFIMLYVAMWRARHPDRHPPVSDLVDKYEDKNCGYIPPIHRTAFQRRDAPWMLPPVGYTEAFDERLNAFYAHSAGDRLYWSFDERGQREWGKKIVTESEAEKRSAAFAARKQSEQ